MLTILVEFNPNANDDFSGWERPDDPAFPTGCVTEPAGTKLNGPLHNNLPNPAKVGKGTDNNTFWVPNFSSTLYNKMIYSKAGVKQHIRKDLKGGLDISGRTVRNFYNEMSKGRYQLGGTVSPWLTLPHSEAWYSADSCEAGRHSDVGHPDNTRGTGQMAIDAVTALAAANPGFPWADYDQEDQGDFDDDSDLFEPDGAIDHLVVLHAGKDQADDGGAEGTYAEWSSSQVVGSGHRWHRGAGGRRTPGVQLHHAARGCRDRRDRARVRPRPRSAGPLRLDRPDRHRRGLVGPDEHRFAQR